ncbi:4-amino-4-deoxy-L-arabinose-phosphoundecaprenol flippase subunit ArnE [compost metagenome]
MSLQTILLTLATIFLWGLIPIFDKLALSHFSTSPLVGIAIRTVGVSAIAIPLALTIGKGTRLIRELPPLAVGLFLASGITSMLLAQYCYYLLLQRVDVSRVFPFLFSAAPVVTMLIGVFGLKETLSAKQIVGAALVVVGGLFLL